MTHEDFIFKKALEEDEKWKCPKCDEYWVSCPCCKASFCPNCGVLESDIVKKALKEVDQIQKGELPKKIARQFLIEELTNKACDRNDEALKWLDD